MSTTRPNVVIIMTDQQQASVLPFYGNPVLKTPNRPAI
jgi:arylsulfatase A-like enzyme